MQSYAAREKHVPLFVYGAMVHEQHVGTAMHQKQMTESHNFPLINCFSFS
jgi:hypothetical protein